ncbi:RNA-directed DNA polymerase from transposon X-element [Elysia marginata]|uniref:RNA-directed DNA polymerase from transposon X-element n=1 Tax=Elysia marginata TaxID=1093978 RepID=A0AAV4FZD7_9GAST|nr:RNA-directed DNA polymerase from transposon X-element [Elysia marginata]
MRGKIFFSQAIQYRSGLLHCYKYHGMFETAVQYSGKELREAVERYRDIELPYAGIPGNEKVDELAKLAFNQEMPDHKQVICSNLKLKVNTHLEQLWQTDWDTEVNNILHEIRPNLKEKLVYDERLDRKQETVVTRTISPRECVSSAAELENELCNVASDGSGKFTEPPASDDFATAEAELLSSNEVGPPLMEKLGTFVKIVTNRFTKKLDEVSLKKKLSEQKRPSNCPSLSAPLTNPLIWQVLEAPYKRNDVRLNNAQINISKPATAVALAVEPLHDLKDQLPSLQKLLGFLLDAVSFLGHTHQHLTALVEVSLPAGIWSGAHQHTTLASPFQS